MLIVVAEYFAEISVMKSQTKFLPVLSANINPLIRLVLFATSEQERPKDTVSVVAV